MTDTAPLTDALDALQAHIGRGNAERGFHEEGDRLRLRAGVTNGAQSFDQHDVAALRNYYMTKLALIHSEVTEAVEELRNGRSADERYYSGGQWVLHEPGDQNPLATTIEEVEALPEDIYGEPRKPEGVPSELADVVIRVFDFADEAGFSLGEVIAEKLAYNSTRERLHGGKTV